MLAHVVPVNRRPGESRDPPCSVSKADPWVRAFAGMTDKLIRFVGVFSLRHASRCDVLRALAKDIFLDLAGRGLRQWAEDDRSRRLEMRQMFAAPGDDVGGRDIAGIGLQCDESAGRLAPSR